MRGRDPRRSFAASSENQKLMFEEETFGNHRSRAAGTKQEDHGFQKMGSQDEKTVHREYVSNPVQRRQVRSECLENAKDLQFATYTWKPPAVLPVMMVPILDRLGCFVPRKFVITIVLRIRLAISKKILANI